MGKVEETKQASSPAKRGINWLTVIGIVVLLLLIAVVAVALWTANEAKENPAVVQLQEAWPYINAMNTMTQAQIRDQAREMTVRELLLDPEAYKGAGQYVIVTGGVSKEESMLITQEMARDVFSEEFTFGEEKYDFQGYILGDGLVVVDITSENHGTLAEGAEIRAFGRVFVLKVSDLFLLPWVGPDLKKSFGGVEGTDEKVVFLFSKGIELVAPGETTESGPTAVVGEDGAAPADGATLPAEAPPGAEGEPPAPPETGAEPPAAPPATPPADPGQGG